MRRGCPKGGWPKKLYDIPKGLRLPNEGSPFQTPVTLKIDLDRRQNWERWTWDRYIRLCSFLNQTPAEVASIACIEHKHLPIFEERNRLWDTRKPNLAGALNLSLYEAETCAAYTKDIIANPFPAPVSQSSQSNASP